MMIAAVTHLSLLLLSCCWLQKEEETGVHSSAFHKHFFQLPKYFRVGFPYLFHTYFSFFPNWISERLHLHLLPHLSLIPSYYHIWWSSYLGNNFVSDGHFLNRFCLAKPKWVNMWINLLMHTILDMAIKIFWICKIDLLRYCQFKSVRDGPNKQNRFIAGTNIINAVNFL